MITATFNALESKFDGSPGAPIGLCVLIADPKSAADDRRRSGQIRERFTPDTWPMDGRCGSLTSRGP